MVRASEIALKAGLNSVYIGNVHNIEGGITFCPECHAPLIVRDWYLIKKCRLSIDGYCPDCDMAVAGRFATKAGHLGHQRVPLTMEAMNAARFGEGGLALARCFVCENTNLLAACGCSSVDRVLASEAKGRGFDPRQPHQH